MVSKVAWRLMPLIMVCYLFALFDRINISFAKFQLQADLGLSDTAYGLGAGLFVVGYVIFEVPSNIMLTRSGLAGGSRGSWCPGGWRRRLMVFVTAEWQFYVLRFLIGAMEAGFAPGVLYYLTLWFPRTSVAYYLDAVPRFGVCRAGGGAVLRAGAGAHGRCAANARLALAVPARRMPCVVLGVDGADASSRTVLKMRRG